MFDLYSDADFAEICRQDPEWVEPTPQQLAYEQVEKIARLEAARCAIEAAQAEAMVVFLAMNEARVEAERAAEEKPPPVEKARCDAFEQTSAEIAMRLKIAGPAASARLIEAASLVARPALLEALSAGMLTPTKVWILQDQAGNLTPDQAYAVIDRVLSYAANQIPSQFRRAVRKAVADTDPDALKRRVASAKKDRGVWKRDLADGMAELSMVGPAAEVTGAFAVLDELGRQCARDTEDDDRTLANRRFDAAVDLICGPIGCPAEGSTAADSKRGPLWRRNVKVDVRVTVPFANLLGIDGKPGHLIGYGAIDADTACELAANGTWRRILTDPATGNPVDFGTTKYRPPARLRDAILTAHPTCQRPGCTMPAFARVFTSDGHVCRRLSRAGTQPSANMTVRSEDTRMGWPIAHHDNGNSIWRTPSGHEYTYTPEPIADPVEPAPPSTCDGEPPF